ncbi:hypothetical protein [Zooshikella sp. RANM57]|uniref:hypothetical protein n=1 Tax=Zooshikella sp. RANM57 TaxID=3425863 RepID=UPI003D6F8E73
MKEEKQSDKRQEKPIFSFEEVTLKYHRNLILCSVICWAYGSSALTFKDETNITVFPFKNATLDHIFFENGLVLVTIYFLIMFIISALNDGLRWRIKLVIKNSLPKTGSVGAGQVAHELQHKTYSTALEKVNNSTPSNAKFKVYDTDDINRIFQEIFRQLDDLSDKYNSDREPDLEPINNYFNLIKNTFKEDRDLIIKYDKGFRYWSYFDWIYWFIFQSMLPIVFCIYSIILIFYR